LKKIRSPEVFLWIRKTRPNYRFPCGGGDAGTSGDDGDGDGDGNGDGAAAVMPIATDRSIGMRQLSKVS
jgi:hypothetical protein